MKNLNGIIIYENLKEIIDPGHSCLVVWDVQNALVNHIFNRNEFMPNLKILIDKIHGKMPVFYTLITPLPRDFSSSWTIYSMLKRFNVDDVSKIPVFMAPGSEDRKVPSSVEPKPGDIVLEKSTANIFLGTNFEPMLRNRNITTILFTGIATEMGVESSARGASNRGFYPVIVSDCVSSADKEAHGRSLKNMARLFVMATNDEILKALDNY